MSIESARKLSHQDWLMRSKDLNIKSGLFIDGTFTDSTSGERFDTINPATGEVIAEIVKGGEVDVQRAVASAKAAWNKGDWRHMAPRTRMVVLNRLADLIEENAEELALMESLDMGKPIRDAVSFDVPEVAMTFRYYAECLDKIEGSVTHTAPEVMHLILREPLGVVGAITPWNYPLLMAVWKVAPALAAGNCLVLKPASQTPLTCLKLAELFVDAGGPPGVFNIVNGSGGDAGKALALHPDVSKIAFTGSTDIGKQILIYAGQSNMKKVGLETGGKSPQIFMPDLEDLDRAVEYACSGIFENTGQVCNAGSRLLVHRDIHDAFVERFQERSYAAHQPGDPLNPLTTMGPLATRDHQQGVLASIEKGVAEGATLALGGGIPVGMEQGAYVQPTLFTNVDRNMTIAREEIFGPVAVVMPFSTEEEAIEIANDSIYGLAGSVWTRDLKTAHRMVRAIESGLVWVNCFGDGDMTQPFGGYKQSGNSRDKGIGSLLSYTQTKSAWFRWD